VSLPVKHALLALAFLLAAAGCEREARRFQKPPSAIESPRTGERQGALVPGQPGEGIAETAHSRTFDAGNAFELSQGKRLFRWYNCSGCHSQGGGGMGPALMDEKWLYGHEPDQIFTTIMEGRPNGMPSFRGRIPEEQAWQLVGYVRSMSGLAPKAARPSRSDALGGAIIPESRRGTLVPHPDPRKSP
jgi:cytochrome c oxidase cbb3-type subunit 3